MVHPTTVLTSSESQHPTSVQLLNSGPKRQKNRGNATTPDLLWKQDYNENELYKHTVRHYIYIYIDTR